MTDRLRLAFALLTVAACDCGDNTLDQLEAAITLTPDPLVFDTIPRGTQAVRILTVSNPGQLPLHVSAVMIESGEGFDFPGETTFVVEPGGAHELPIRFTSGATAAVEGSVVVDSDAVETPRARAALRASRRTGPVLAVCVESADLALPLACDVPASIDFGRVPIGETREALLSLRSEGSDPLSISAVTFSGHPSFELDAEVVPAVIVPGERLDLPVRFIAAVTESVEASITVSSNDVDAAETNVALSGAGADLVLCAEPAILDFGEVLVGASAELPVKLTACGAAPVDVTAIELFLGGPELSLSSTITLPITLFPQAGLQFEVNVRYAPVDEGEDRGRLRIRTADGASIVQLVGRSSACRLVATPESLHFNWETAAGDLRRALLLQNTGTQPCTLDRVEIVEGSELGFTFGSRALITELPDLPLVLEPGGAVTANVNFSPRRLAMSMVAGRIEIAVLERPDLVEVELSAAVVAAGRCELTASPSSLTFGLVGAGEQRHLGLRLLNGPLDTTPCRLAGVTLTDDAGGAFRLLGAPPDIVWGEVFVYVELVPPAPGAYRGELSIVTADTPPATLLIPLSGGSGTPSLCVSPRELPFGATTTTSTRTFELSACAGDSVTVEALSWTEPDPELSLRAPPALPFTLAPGESRTVVVEYSPVDQDGDTGVVTVRSSDPLAPEVTVRATGGPELTPIEAGRYLFFWQITNASTSDIVRAPLQGALATLPYFGERTGQRCGACHQLSPDGKYVAVSTLDPLGYASLAMLETESGALAGAPTTLLDGFSNELFVSWNPDVNTVPPYQYAYSIAGDIQRASLFGGNEGPVMGASDPGAHESMPAWGPDGQIAFVRWDDPNGGFGIPGATGLHVVDEAGGTPSALAGASANGFGNYYPRYSPDGRWIAFTVSESAIGAISAPDAQVRIVRADGSGTVAPLTALNEGASSFPIWSADGSFLSFSSNRPGGAGSWDLYIAPVDTLSGEAGTAVPITAANTEGFEHAAQWQP